VLTILYAGCSDLFLVILVQFTFEMCVAAQSRKKKSPNFVFCEFKVVQLSSVLILLESSSAVLVIL